MYALNLVLRALFDALLYPFRTMPAIVGIAVVSLVTSIAMLIVFRATSNQDAISAVKRKIHAGLFEIRLFNDDFRAILRAQWDILRHNLAYLKHSLVPMVFILPPMVLAIAQLQFHYGYDGMGPGQTTILEVELAEGWDAGGAVPTAESGKPRVTLDLPEGVVAETPSVWIPSERTLVWRLRSESAADRVVGIEVGDTRYEKALPGADSVIERRSPVRTDRSFLEQLIYPAEPPLPEGSVVSAIRIQLAPADLPIGGWTLKEMAGVPAWMIAYFLLSIVFAFALRKPMGVEI